MTVKAAMIFAAGFGTRMGELTQNTPKPMLELGGMPMVDHSINLVRSAGIQNVVANTHYLPERIEAHLKDKGVVVSHEPKILDTGGGLKAALPLLNTNPVLTINPDAAWFGPNPVKHILDAWDESMTALLMCVPAETNSDFNLSNGHISRVGPFKYTGVQIIRHDRLNQIEEKVFSLNQYWDLLMYDGKVHGIVYPGEWFDIGTAAGLESANKRIRQ